MSWFTAAPTSAKASNGATLVPLADRSIRASGKADKGTYTLTFRTPLRNIRGLRLEALTAFTSRQRGLQRQADQAALTIKGAAISRQSTLEKQWVRSPIAGLVSEVKVKSVTAKGVTLEIVVLEEEVKRNVN